MRLQPVEKPKSLYLKAAYWYSKKKLGKVITPLKVLYARVPALISFSTKIIKTEKKLRLDPALKLMIKTLVAQTNDCTFCVDIAEATAIDENISLDKFYELNRFRENEIYSESEKAALAYAEESTKHKKVADETFERLKALFTEKEIVEITWIVAIENYYNLINLPLDIHSDGLCAIRQRPNKN